MPQRWSPEQVVALAPDASSVAAGRKLAAAGPWSQTGATAEPAAVWGLCKGSGKTPYQTIVDLTGPAYRCSCPSRKFPCKHALGLLLLWSAGGVEETAAPSDFAAAWLDSRAAKAARSTTAGADGTGTGVDGTSAGVDGTSAGADGTGVQRDAERAARRRAEQRAERMGAGAADLDRWLRDRVRTGLAGADRAGYGDVDAVAARLVDAQAQVLAGGVRRLAGVAASGDGWPGRLLAELALLRLLTAAHSRLADLPEPLAATVRARVGYPVRTEDVLATPAVRDRWNVLSLRDSTEDRLVVRRVVLLGEHTGRVAVVLSFAPPGQPLDASLVPGRSLEADLHFHPGSAPRAVVGARHGEPGVLGAVAGAGVAAALASWAQALAADPWLTSWPVVLAAVVPAADPGEDRPGSLLDEAGDALPLAPGAEPWHLLAVSGGRPVTVVAEQTPLGLHPLSALTEHGLVAL
ncbi:SWIM zinc finger family protein [Kineococcus xinjiangensis]|uniref:SWIM zinc finger family protein n=1 Tax=Kineococcus xinjiangensis TaxID=512762 RepID=UPI001FE4854B|nr:SWIM zinc finger family protein [Kineococcus xinjiangensis]